MDHIYRSNTLVLGAGYDKSEYSRLSSIAPDYVGVGGSGSSVHDGEVIQQLDVLGDQAIIIGAEATAEVLLDFREGRKFPVIIIDRCVQNYMLKSIPHPEFGKRPDGTYNGLKKAIIDKESFNMKMINLLLEPTGSIIFVDSFGEEYLDTLRDIFKGAIVDTLNEQTREQMLASECCS